MLLVQIGRELIKYAHHNRCGSLVYGLTISSGGSKLSDVRVLKEAMKNDPVSMNSNHPGPALARVGPPFQSIVNDPHDLDSLPKYGCTCVIIE